MATNPAQTQQPPAPAIPLWPAPVFVLGVAALVAVVTCRPLFRGAARSDHFLAQARKELARPDGEPAKAIELAQQALDLGTARSGEAHYVIGAAHLRRAEKAEPPAAQHWQQARQSLEQAEADGVKSPEDRAALTYHLAKVDFHDGRETRDVIARLTSCADQIDNRAEAYDLLTRAYLRLNPPDLDKAADSNKRLREVPTLTGPDLAAAQLMGAELLIRQNNPKDARQDLELLLKGGGQFAQPAVLARARLLLARSHQDEKRFEQAIALYREAMQDRRTAVPQPAQVYYNLGLCYSELKKPQDAIDAWKECMRLAQGNEAQAVGIVLADVSLLNNSPPDAIIDALVRAVAGIKSPADWVPSHLVELPMARKVFERAITAFRMAGRHDLAIKTLEPYSRLAEPRRTLEWRGLLCAELARTRREKTAADPQANDDRETTELLRQAAEAYGKAAELSGLKPVEVANYLWAAVPCHLSVGDPKERESARQKLEKLVTMELEPARMGEAWYLLGEERRAADKGKEAEKAYLECLKYVTRFAYLARYQLAKAALMRGEIDAAREALQQNLRQLTWDSDSEAMSQTLFELCGLLYRRGAYRDVVRHYEEALGRYADRFKDKKELAKARHQLADSYHQIASQENVSALLGANYAKETREHLAKMHREWLVRAANEFSSLDTFLDTPEGQNGLPAEQRTQVPFVAAKCWFNVGEYEKALAVYEKLIDKYKGKVEALDALGGAVSCLAARGDVKKVQQRLIEIDKMLEKMPPEIRKPWLEWLEAAKLGLKDV